MKQLEKEFIGRGEVKDFRFKQIEATDKAYLYEITTDFGVHYEVFKHKENVKFGCVSYPKSKSFGVWAWCIHGLENAKQKFEELNVVKDEKVLVDHPL